MRTPTICMLLAALALACDQGAGPKDAHDHGHEGGPGHKHVIPDKGAECGVEGLAADELTKMLQQTLEIDALAPFWHADQPGRKPLKILKTHVAKNEPKLQMFGSPVAYVEVDKAEDPYFAFTKVDMHPDTVTIEFSYPVEGVKGSAFFAKHDGKWVLEQKKVVEK